MYIKYIGDPLSYSRKGQVDRIIIDELYKTNKIMLSLHPRKQHNLDASQVNIISRLASNVMPYSAVIHSLVPSSIVIESGKTNIALVDCKTSSVPTSWIGPLSRVDYIITPSAFTRAAIQRSSIPTEVYIFNLPMTQCKLEPMPLPPEVRPLKYLMIPEYNLSSNWVDAVLAFSDTFTKDYPATLIVHTASEVIMECISTLVAGRGSSIIVMNSMFTDTDLARLCSSVTYMYNPYRGTCIDPYMITAVSVGTPCICTSYGAPMQYLTPDNSFLIPSRVYPAGTCEADPDYTESTFWSAPIDISAILELSKSSPSESITSNIDSSVLEVIEGIDERRRVAPKLEVRVSIIVLSYNNLPMLSKCMDALEANTIHSKFRYEIIVLDNGSESTDTALLAYLKILERDISNCRVTYSSVNHGFSGGNNIASALAKGDILLFLNNDTEVQEGWLDPIVRCFDADERVGIVGSRLVYPNWTIQHVGIQFGGGEYYASHPYTGEPYDHPMALLRKEMHAVTGASLAIRRDLFNSIAGFDVSYIKGYYEDADMCCKVRDMGYKIIYEPDSIVIHKHGQSFKKLGDITKQDFFIHNCNQFKERHTEKVMGSQRLFRSKHYYEPGRRNIGILNSYMHTLGGGEKLTVCIAKSLEDNNNVDILLKSNTSISRSVVYDSLGIKLLTTEFVGLCAGEDPRYYRDYDIFINGQWGSNDVGSGRKNIYSCMFPQKVDKDVLDTYDDIWSISEFTAKYVKEYWDRESKIVYPPVTMMGTVDEIPELIVNKKNMILSIGRFFEGGHCKKHKVMINAFKRMVDDKVIDSSWRLVLAGALKERPEDIKYYNECVTDATGYNISLYPNSSFSTLRDMYRQSKVYWHAGGYGETCPENHEHFGIAPVEAMSAGCYVMLYHGGGLVELCPFLTTWIDVDNLVSMMSAYIGGGASTPDYTMKSLIERANEFSVDKYTKRIRKLIGGL